MILYRQATGEDFEFTFKIKAIAIKKIVEEIWGWDNDLQLEYLKNQFSPNKTKIIIYDTQEVGYLSTSIIGNILLIENILVHTDFQGRNIGT